jgi:hypothetical protein
MYRAASNVPMNSDNVATNVVNTVNILTSRIITANELVYKQ